MRLWVSGVLAAIALSASTASAAEARSIDGQQPEADAAVLASEWQVARSPSDVLAAARAELLDLGFRVERQDDAAGLLVTRAQAWHVSWPAAAALGLPATRAPTSIALHLYVPPAFEPARLVVGALFETATWFVPLTRRGTSTVYGDAASAAFFAQRIATRLGVALQPLAADAATRFAQAAAGGSVRPAGCGAPGIVEATAATSQARPIHIVKPVYPAGEIQNRVGGEVIVRGEVTEHGTFSNVVWVGGVEDANLVAAARGAARLWRFKAATVGACPARSLIHLGISYGLVR